MKYNKGEWTEFYVFLYILTHSQDIINQVQNWNLKMTLGNKIRVKKRDGNDTLVFEVCNNIISIFKNNNQIKVVNSSDFNDITEIIFKKIKKSAGSSFEIQECEATLSQLCLSSFKAPADAKSDLTINVDYNGNWLKFDLSIKSFLGNNPCILSATKATSFKYLISGNINDDDMKYINSICTSTNGVALKSRIAEIIKNNTIYPVCPVSDNFKNNLDAIDTKLSNILMKMLLIYAKDGIRNLKEECDKLCNDEFDDNHAYGIVKKFLIASLLWLTPSNTKNQNRVLADGMLTVYKNGNIELVNSKDNKFGEKLLSVSRMDRGSANKYDYGYVYKKDDKYYINLNLQVRMAS